MTLSVKDTMIIFLAVVAIVSWSILIVRIYKDVRK